jgi:cytochrome c oxidase assembly protein subunit 15
MMTPAGPRRIDSRAVSTWLFVMSALIALMVTVGGATRLTDSGLSIVEWRPVTGAIPPLSEVHWREEFGKYQTIPEYQLVNRGMSLAEFKVIYWWEWGHRFLGRLLGVAFLAPMLYFILTRKVSGPLTLKLGGLFLLGGAQGALGWWMVASGLSERVDVSQYRLAAHLSLAVILFGLIFWTGLDVRTSGVSAGQRFGPPDLGPKSRRLAVAAFALALLVFMQMVLGAFVAGLRAGRAFNTWPLMDGRFFPAGYFYDAPGLNDLFETHAAVQFNHRIGACVLIAAAIWFFLATRRSALAGPARLLLIAVVLQGALGIWTVLAATPIGLGLLHQAGALAVFAIALYAAHSGSAGLAVGGGANSGISGSAAAAPSR